MAKENKCVYFSCFLHAFDALSEDGYLHVLEQETQSRGRHGPIDLQRIRNSPWSLIL
jgi:hypothetical protein